MDNSNIKVYLGISVALVVLLILIIVIPFSKKSSSSLRPTPYTLLSPTPYTLPPTPLNVSADSTGVAEEELPQEVVDASYQKQDLRNQLPISLSSFSIDFNYAEDKFIVTLNDPKGQSRNEFNQWKNNTYPGIEVSQFNFQ